MKKSSNAWLDIPQLTCPVMLKPVYVNSFDGAILLQNSFGQGSGYKVLTRVMLIDEASCRNAKPQGLYGKSRIFISLFLLLGCTSSVMLI